MAPPILKNQYNVVLPKEAGENKIIRSRRLLNEKSPYSINYDVVLLEDRGWDYSVVENSGFCQRIVDEENKKITDYIFGESKERLFHDKGRWVCELKPTNLVSHYVMTEVFKGEKITSHTKAIKLIMDSLDMRSNNISPLVIGKWGTTGTFNSTNKPGRYNSTSDILFIHYFKKKVVRYVQCWIYSFLMTSFLSFIGIDCKPLFGMHLQINRNMNMGVNYCDRNISNKGSGGGQGLGSIDDSSIGMNMLSLTEDFKDSKYIDLESFESTKKSVMFNDNLKNGDTSWNFHVFNAIKIIRDDLNETSYTVNYIDSTPMDDVDALNFGPVKIENIKENIPEGEQFGYIYPSFNGVEKTWSAKTMKCGKKLIYTYNMDYNSNIKIKFKGESPDKDKDYTNSFKHTDKKLAYKTYHKEHPLYFTSTSLDDLVVNEKKRKGNYLVQIVWLDDKNPVYYSLNETDDLRNLDIKMNKCSDDDDDYWNKINLITYDKDNNKIWAQIISSNL